ncbi:aldo/keto reductase [Frondihabitans australicus]|uniref:Aryl-alcohol dehydrogenase-like predicted oxidoreductase n=1 Tax=Frondihabitans australicus TaxID=386892 RepID=A0A495II09_9MICO|nr:aldo/keto reductase [Frondihabitans australicus]RKR75613.1 aryl-alcohol dehydrogenase-like predicted oxidoreductase [Frondihabitans australicus]
MEQRRLGRTPFDVSVIGLGTWQLGADWGDVSETEAFAVLDASAEAGVTLFDTADVYGDGKSEQTIGRWRRSNEDAPLTVATKMGRREPQEVANYSRANFITWVDRSRRNLGQDTLDLVQLHCPPTPVFASDEVYDALDELVERRMIAAYGVSVETCAQALTAIARPNLATVQIILNAFRLKPLDEVLPAAQEAGVGIIARVPLASGLLSGRYTEETTFAPNDHRSFNRHGEAFDQGETFSGVDFETGVRAARDFAKLVPEGVSESQAALKWIVEQPGVSTVIPGARNVDQARSNAEAGSVFDLGDEFHDRVERLYDREFRSVIHSRW